MQIRLLPQYIVFNIGKQSLGYHSRDWKYLPKNEETKWRFITLDFFKQTRTTPRNPRDGPTYTRGTPWVPGEQRKWQSSLCAKPNVEFHRSHLVQLLALWASGWSRSENNSTNWVVPQTIALIIVSGTKKYTGKYNFMAAYLFLALQVNARS